MLTQNDNTLGSVKYTRVRDRLATSDNDLPEIFTHPLL
jgi:hypothetical protein